MLPSFALATGAAAAAAAIMMTTLSRLDCNPTLWTYDALRAYDRPISGQTIWIIGASSGIGRELALQLSKKNNNLILSARNDAKLQAVARECRQSREAADGIQIHVLDVTNMTALLEASQKIDCDICILNAGKGHLSLVEETSPETAVAMLNGNALWQMVLAPTLRCRHLVVMSSIAGFLPVPLSAAYAASKHALQGYFRSFAAERSDMIVDLVCPGPVDTDFHAHSKDQGAIAEGSTPSPSPLKMSAQRCAQLTLAAASRSHYSKRGSTVWICPQPTLTALYLEKFLPSQVFSNLMQSVAAKRIDLYRRGVDLYDPASWRK